MSNLRRSMMMAGREGGASAVVRGEYVLASDAASFTITHNLNTQNYLLLVRAQTPVSNVNACNGTFVLGKYIPTHLSCYGNGSMHSVIAWVFEVRTNNATYQGVPNQMNTIESGFGANSAVVAARSSSYPFKAGTYDWMAINLDLVADAQGDVTTTEGLQTITINDNLGTANKIGVMYADTPTLNINGSVGFIYHHDYFAGMIRSGTTGTGYEFETRNTSAYLDNSQIVTAPTAGSTANSLDFTARTATYKFAAGKYYYKIYKI